MGSAIPRIYSGSREINLSVELAEGLVLSFQDKAKSELPGVVSLIEDRMVTVDFNHPLAGRVLIRG